jgi:ABC-type multidrug transport system fused ATPase/permease subunit
MTPQKNPYPWSQYLKDYWMLLEGRRFRFVFYTIMTSISNLVPFAIAFIMGKIIDFFINYSSGPLNRFYLYVALITILGGFQVWLRFYGKNGLQVVAAEIRKGVRVEVMSKLMDLELKWHDKEDTGSKIHKINEGGENVYYGITSFSNDGIYILTGLFGGLILFFFLDLKFLIFALAYVAIYLCAEYYFNKKVTFWQGRMSKIREKVSGKMNESASNLLTVKSLGLKDVFKQSTISYEDKYYRIWRKSKDISQAKFKAVKIFSAVCYGFFILLVGMDAVSGSITAGSILVIVAYFDRLINATDKITNSTYDFIRIKTSVGRFMTIFGIELFDKEDDLLDIPKNWKTVEFKNLTFKYKDNNVLENFNLKINRGEKIGVVGKSGCGKSTLVKLILRLYTPESGNILIDGKDLCEYKHKSITDTFAIVLQESEVFNDSLLKNVTISSVKSDFKNFEKALKISQLEPLIKKLPKGINTLLGEKGYHLSGGERQRIGIARAVYKNSPFLMLDEATSSLDSKTESLIQKSIEVQLKDKTLLIIAHRLSTLRSVDRIIVVENGRIIEQGSYGELLNKKGKFYGLWKQQKQWKN